MLIRKLRKDEKFKSDMLMSASFGFKCDVEKVKKEELPEGAEIIGAFLDDGETLMAQISLIEYQSRYYGQYLKSVGIAGVSTLPQYRRAGCVRKIFDYIFDMCGERGWDASFLYPFSFRYYRKFGYERVVQHKNYRLPFSEMSHLPRNDEAMLLTCPEQQKDMLEIYQQFSKDFNVIFGRKYNGDKKIAPYGDGIFTYIWYDEGTPASYAITRGDGRVLVVDELVYANPKALEGILGFLRMYEGQYDSVSFNILSKNEYIEYLTDADRASAYGIFDGVMGRIINIEKALTLYPYPQNSGTLTLKITGDVIYENNAYYKVEYANGKAISVVSAGEGEADMEISIQSFSRLVFGDFEESRIEYLPDTKVFSNKPKEIFKSHPTHLFERF